MTSKASKIITIGTFDGVHIGHQKIVSHIVKQARLDGLEPVVLTLFPHPRMVLQKDDSIKLINTIEERIELLKSFGVTEVVVKPFTKTFANLSPKEYVQHVLVDELNTKKIVIGYDHRFGKNRSANIKDLIAFAETYNFEVEEISAQDIEDVTVSSTKIRNALAEGNILLANSFLGYNYFISGEVIKGKGIGRTIDFPTANINVKEDYKLIPANGVYVVKSEINNKTVYGMLNIGLNPTVNGTSKSIEAHFFDVNKDLYNSKLKIEFLKRIRDEHKFEHVEALKTQLHKDKTFALSFIKKQNV